jgi:hypothetical protein
MRIRYRETGKTDDVELCHVVGPVLVGRGNPCYLEDLPDQPHFITPDTFGDWELVSASENERRELRDAGFPA